MDSAAAVGGLCSVFTGIEQSAQFTVEAGPWNNELNSY